MESLRDKLLDVIASALPDAPEILKFCEGDSFPLMLDKVIETVINHITEEE